MRAFRAAAGAAPTLLLALVALWALPLSTAADDDGATTASIAATSAAASDAGGGFDCTAYQGSVDILPGKLTLEYVAARSSDRNATDTADRDTETSFDLRVRLTSRLRNQESYIGFGLPSNAECATNCMIGATSVVGAPSTGTARMLHLEGYEAGQYKSVGDGDGGALTIGELVDPRSDFVDGESTLSFTLRIAEGGGDEVEKSGQQRLTVPGRHRFIWAVGEDTGPFFNDHFARGSFYLELNPCTPTDNGVGDKIVLEVPEAPYRREWTSHAVLAGLAWGGLAPAAVAASVLRDALPPGGLWYKIHFYANIMGAIFTLAAFGLSVAVYAKAGRAQFKGGTHQILGLVMTILLGVQVFFGFARPPAAPKKQPKEVNDIGQTEGTENAANGTFNDEEAAGEENGTTNEESGPQGQTKTQTKKPLVRVLWEIGHRLAGLALLGIGLYQCHSGLGLYDNLFAPGSNALSVGVPVFWGWIGTFTAFVAAVFARTKLSGRGRLP